MHPSDFACPTLAADVAPAAGRVRVRWLGTAGYALACDGVTLLIDPYLTRASLPRVLTRALAPDPAAIDAVIGPVDAVFVSHSHFDHALDVPYIARRTGAQVYGSRSVAQLMAAAGLPAHQVTTLEPGRSATFEVGPFRLTAVPSAHSPFGLGGRVPLSGDIPCSCELPLRAHRYRCGDVFAFRVEVGGRAIFHLGSANLVDEAVPRGPVELLLLCIAARFAAPDVVRRALRAVRPDRVMPMHYDNLFRSAQEPMRLLPRTRFGRFVDDVHRFDRQLEVATLPLLGALELGS